MQFSLMLWGDSAQNDSTQIYDLLIKAAVHADENGYAGIRIPERHFHAFGGEYPNPAVLAAAVAMRTKHIRIRAGSVVFPLHHPLRIAEEWAVVDHLSGGRVEVSAASGWQPDDFVLAPDIYESRQAEMWSMIGVVQDLWRGKPFVGKNGKGTETSVTTLPRPVQPELPIWVTSGGSPLTINAAGHGGYNLLTHLLGQTFETVGQKIGQYTASAVAAGVKRGKVALMLHTFVGPDAAVIEAIVRQPLKKYLKQSAELSVPAAERERMASLPADLVEEMMDIAYQRYVSTASLVGTPDTCAKLVDKVTALGVDEIVCLIDFGAPRGEVLNALQYLTAVKNAVKK